MDYQKLLSRTVQEIPPSGIRKFFDIVSEMKDALSLSVGEPDFTTPWNVCEAAIYSLERGQTHYSSNWGTISLRREIARYLSARYALEYDPEDEIIATVGASEGIDLALRALLNPGDEVLVPDPSFVAYMPCVRLAGGVAVPVKTGAEDGFKITPGQLRAAITPRTKALILPYPNNPTGGVMERADLEAVAAVLRGSGIFVIADEIYSELTYGQGHVSFAAIEGMRERTVLLNGFSKAFAMTGWRMGYLCAPRELAAMACKIHQYTIMCAPMQAQAAAEEALVSGFETGYAQVEGMRRIYDQRRRLLFKGLNDMGLDCFEPLGAFYLFPSIRSTGLPSEVFCEKLLREEKVAIVPGNAFGAAGEGHVRICYAVATEVIVEALKRIDRFIKSLK
ncbi:MAG: aminotransferase class I/II-fold pyridoxal phosphate-dependent enzyme [Christensenellaceae bacterium]|jgi:aminotransferase|nr:aminotransferase class I/II-fold pyridoxal phosphate-dependent enzyme [Christensenellaceae bacterium]